MGYINGLVVRKSALLFPKRWVVVRLYASSVESRPQVKGYAPIGELYLRLIKGTYSSKTGANFLHVGRERHTAGSLAIDKLPVSLLPRTIEKPQLPPSGAGAYCCHAVTGIFHRIFYLQLNRIWMDIYPDLPEKPKLGESDRIRDHDLTCSITVLITKNYSTSNPSDILLVDHSLLILYTPVKALSENL